LLCGLEVVVVVVVNVHFVFHIRVVHIRIPLLLPVLLVKTESPKLDLLFASEIEWRELL
jgi:hypothetical protein